MLAIGFPDNFSQYKELSVANPGSQETLFSDGTLIIMNSSMQPNIEVKFQDIFPVAISDINFTTTDTDVNYVTNTVTFKYKRFFVTKL